MPNAPPFPPGFKPGNLGFEFPNSKNASPCPFLYMLNRIWFRGFPSPLETRKPPKLSLAIDPQPLCGFDAIMRTGSVTTGPDSGWALASPRNAPCPDRLRNKMLKDELFVPLSPNGSGARRRGAEELAKPDQGFCARRACNNRLESGFPFEPSKATTTFRNRPFDKLNARSFSSVRSDSTQVSPKIAHRGERLDFPPRKAARPERSSELLDRKRLQLLGTWSVLGPERAVFFPPARTACLPNQFRRPATRKETIPRRWTGNSPTEKADNSSPSLNSPSAHSGSDL